MNIYSQQSLSNFIPQFVAKFLALILLCHQDLVCQLTQPLLEPERIFQHFSPWLPMDGFGIWPSFLQSGQKLRLPIGFCRLLWLVAKTVLMFDRNVWHFRWI